MSSIELIAQKAGVSRGTVDRVIHNRGRVDPATAERVREVIRELDYHPSTLGRAFYMARQKNKIGVLVSFREPDFQSLVEHGIEDGAAYALQHGIEVITETASPDDPEAYLGALERLLAQEPRGLVLRGIDSEAVNARLASLPAGFPVVAINVDIDPSLRCCFVGQGSFNAGKCAAHLMDLVSPPVACTLIVGVDLKHTSSEDRIRGFIDYFRSESRSVMDVSHVIYANGDRERTRRATADYLSAYPEITGIFTSGAGLSGAAQAVEEAGLSGKVRVIGFDTTTSNVVYLENGTVQFLIDQDPYQQGYRSVRLLADSIFTGQPITESVCDVDIQIRSVYSYMYSGHDRL